MRKLLNQSGTIHTLPLLLIIAAVGIISFLLISSTAPLNGLFGRTNPKTPSHAASSGCTFSNGAQAAFCDTFDNPNPNPAGMNTRSGSLDGVAWGASRSTSDTNAAQGIYYNINTTPLSLCGASAVGPEKDIQICNGQLVEGLTDNGAVNVLAMYPKQPFDFTGRTGMAVFDVSNDTQGSHMAWPEWVLTDQPVPAPHESAAGIDDFARNSLGISMAAACQDGNLIDPAASGFGNMWSVDKIWITQDSQLALPNFQVTGCVRRPTTQGQMNHVEIRLSQTHQEVWATDAGSTVLKQIATANINLPLTRGLAWMEDVHYNACKDPGTQCTHSFAWDNFGFDGPVLPRDLTFDVLDASHNGSNGGNIGWLLQTTGKGVTTLQVPGVNGIQNASAAYLLFTFFAYEQANITYTINGHSNPVFNWPFGNPADSAFGKSHTLAVPVPLNQLVSGTNTVTLSTSDPGFGNVGSAVANVDLLLVGAAGIPSCINPSQCAGSPTIAPSPTPSATPTPGSSATIAPSSSPNCSKLSIGDTNCDTFINLIDYSTVISHFGQTVPKNTLGDINNSGTVDLIDYSTVISHFGQ